MKMRVFPESNYKGIYFNDKTMRIALDPSKPIDELEYPEFYDVKLTEYCLGKCPECYMDSKPNDPHAENLVQKVYDYFGSMSENERPFQVALGGGEPTTHPEFIDCLLVFYGLGITPNYTTNGMFIDYGPIAIEYLMRATQQLCGGVAISCHEHLDTYWKRAAGYYKSWNIKLNFHIIISDEYSIDRFRRIHDEWFDSVDYFVLLPYGAQGRAKEKQIEWDYLVERAPEDTSKLAFGANFHPYLVNNPGPYNKVSLYEPEAMSQFIDFVQMKLYPSSFHLQPIRNI